MKAAARVADWSFASLLSFPSCSLCTLHTTLMYCIDSCISDFLVTVLMDSSMHS